ncbi:DUF2218 domain-containing protein, partial [Roseibium sp. RKSG952]|nr:DUF2218 domain-containing protein [Roseibium sp. RKSG952]
AKDTALTFNCESDGEDNMKIMQEVISSHLERFAWREELKLQWQTASS